MTTDSPASRVAMWVLPKAIIGASTWLSKLEQGIQDHFKTLPTLLLWGQHDIAFRQKECLRWQQLLPHHLTFLFSSAGHFPEEEVPDYVIEKMRFFLQSDSEQNQIDL